MRGWPCVGLVLGLFGWGAGSLFICGLGLGCVVFCCVSPVLLVGRGSYLFVFFELAWVYFGLCLGLGGLCLPVCFLGAL